MTSVLVWLKKALVGTGWTISLFECMTRLKTVLGLSLSRAFERLTSSIECCHGLDMSIVGGNVWKCCGITELRDGTNVNAIHIPDYVSTSIFIKRELNN